MSLPGSPDATSQDAHPPEGPEDPSGGRAFDWLVAGLGNPGARYAGTRHDLGFMVVDRLAGEGRFVRNGATLMAPCAGLGRVALAKPQAFMNRSGPPLSALLEELGLGADRLLVACDDVNLRLGRLRVRASGSAGGHNGLASVIQAVGEGFPRLRLGVGAPPGGGGQPAVDLADWVLDRFAPDELVVATHLVERGASVVRALVAEGLAAAQREAARPLEG